MTQVKILTAYSLDVLEQTINQFIKSNNIFIISVSDVKIQEVTERDNDKCFAATIIYETSKI